MKLNPDNFTESAWQAIIDAKDLALNENHQTLETEHLFYSLLNKNDISRKIIEKSGSSKELLLRQIKEFIKIQPTMQTRPESIFFGKSLSSSILKAFDIKESYKDKLVSSEHLVISLIDDQRICNKLFDQNQISKNSLLKAIK